MSQHILRDAIRQGAPLYNRGDFEGCAKVYAQAATSALEIASGKAAQRLESGIREAADSPSADAAAWALRFAFDDVLEQTSTAPGPSPVPSPTPASPATSVTGAIRDAISVGVPLFNGGDHSGCYRVYCSACESSLPLLSEDGKKIVQRALRRSKALSSDSDKAWELRRAMDAVLSSSENRNRNRSSGTEEGSLGRGGSSTTSNDVLSKIRASIAVGVPAFNSGNHKACYEAYKECCEEILMSLGCESKRLVVSSLRKATAMQSPTDQAWELRGTLDAIMRDPPRSSDEAGPRSLGAGSEVEAGEQGEDGENPRVLFDFGAESVARGFKSLNDGVMGGRSEGGMRWDAEEQCGVYAGELSTANGGGFSSVVGPTQRIDLPGSKGLWIRYKADAQTYKLQVRRGGDGDLSLLSMFTSGAGNDGVVYQTDLPGPHDQWTEVFIPWSNFKASWRGQPRAAAQPLTGGGIKSVGLMVSKLSAAGGKNPSFRAGPFTLRVKTIGSY